MPATNASSHSFGGYGRIRSYSPRTVIKYTATVAESEQQLWRFSGGVWSFSSETDHIGGSLRCGVLYNGPSTQAQIEREYWSWTVPSGGPVGLELYVQFVISQPAAAFPVVPINFYQQVGTVTPNFANCLTGTNFFSTSPPQGTGYTQTFNVDTGITCPSVGSIVVITTVAANDIASLSQLAPQQSITSIGPAQASILFYGL